MPVSFFPSRTVAFELLGFDVYWYGVLYLVAFLIALLILPRLQHLRGLSLTAGEWSDILTWAIVGVLVGGRLGYVLLYRLQEFSADPMLLFDVRHGGMASHGGFIGVTLALLWAMRKRSWSERLAIADIAVAIGLALGRFGNFINQELYGTVTTLPWGIAVPGVEGLRHPTQLYAVAKDLLIAVLCFSSLFFTRHHFIAGRTMAVFLILYGVFRFVVEFFREQEWVWSVGSWMITPGQVYTVPVILTGLVLLLVLRGSSAKMSGGGADMARAS